MPSKKAKKSTPKSAEKSNHFEGFRERLLGQKEEMFNLYKHDLRVGQEATGDGAEDIVDRANNAYNRELVFSLSDGERELLFQIEEALERIDLGTFGSCSHCQQDITEPRLQAIPWARFCIDCQELEEKGLLHD